MIEAAARSVALGVLGRLRAGRLTVVEDGVARRFGAGPPEATIVVRSPRLWPTLLHGSRGLAEAYRDGLWDSPDLTAVVRVAARNVGAFDELRRRTAVVRDPYQRTRLMLRRNTPLRSRRDIAAHYDLGNDLFELMLDPTMTYSCALFEHPDMSLEEASTAKLEAVCAKLGIGRSDHVVEIGSGWGSFAVHASRSRGCRVTTTTLSREQHDVASERVRAAGVADRVTVLLDNYRELRGRYDKLVSIEMIEAVGPRDFATFFTRCSDLLAPDGAMLLQAIVIDDRAYAIERYSGSFMRTCIFPNGCLPSTEVIARCVARGTDMRTVDLEDLTPNYPLTLRQWRANFDAAADRLRAAGYDEPFQRLWRLYLAYCEAGFAERRIGVTQTVLAKPRWRGSARPDRAPAAAAHRQSA
jgi:cyclopropane-fatty-acyl-phospholipid synthase